MNSTEKADEIISLHEDMFRYGTMSVSHFPEMQAFIDDLYTKKLITDDEIVQSYISEAKYSLPDTFLDARSIIIMAVATPPAVVPVHHKGKLTEVILPPQYYSSGLTRKQLDVTVHQKVIKKEGFRIEKVSGMLLKQMAVRSGLGSYGRNNLVYVDGMGTYHTIHAYLTDFEFDTDSFRDVVMMKECATCNICRSVCPTHCISDDTFVIDAGRCLSVHSERSEPFPHWVTAEMHNALIGCMRCQLTCPIIQSLPGKVTKLEALTEKETDAILSGDWNEEITTSLAKKLKMFTTEYAYEVIPLLKKNLAVLLC